MDALAHAKRYNRYKTFRETIPENDEDGRDADVSFVTQNWQKTLGNRNRPGAFVRKHFEATVFCYPAEELRTGDVAVIGSEEHADWSEQRLPWSVVETKLPAHLVEDGTREAGGDSPFDAAASRSTCSTSSPRSQRRRTPLLG